MAWLRRPANQFGAVLLGGGFVWVGASLANTDVAALVAVGQTLATVPLAVIVHILLVFPSGRLRDRTSRALTAAAYFVALVLQAPLNLFGPAGEPPWDVLAVHPDPTLWNAWVWAQRGTGMAVVAATAAVLVRRWQAAPRGQRRALGPLYGFGTLVVLGVPLSFNLVRPALGLDPLKVVAFQLAVTALVPIAFAICVLRGGFARTAEIEELGAWLGADDRGRLSLRDALADALGDPSLELVFAGSADAEGHGGFVDAAGSPVTPPHGIAGRGISEVRLAGEPVAAIVYDTAAVDDDALVVAAGQVVALAVDRERLTANLRASAETIRASRGRILEAADAERRRIARDLHDGLQARLILLALDANRSGAVAVGAGIEGAIAELREFVQGIMPAGLIEQGLCAAVEDLVDRVSVEVELELPSAPMDLAPSVETAAYFVVAEALSNAVKHSGATVLGIGIARRGGWLRVAVRDNGGGNAALDRGRGLRGLADRVDSLGGRFHLDSRPGRGTRLVAELPCGS